LANPKLAEEVLDLLLPLVAVERLREDLVGARVAFEDDPTVVSVELQRLWRSKRFSTLKDAIRIGGRAHRQA
jgi:hypothetical protein